MMVLARGRVLTFFANVLVVGIDHGLLVLAEPKGCLVDDGSDVCSEREVVEGRGEALGHGVAMGGACGLHAIGRLLPVRTHFGRHRVAP